MIVFIAFLCAASVLHAADIKSEAKAPELKLPEIKVPEKIEKPKPKLKLATLTKEDQEAEGDLITSDGFIVAKNNYGIAVETKFDKKDGSSQEIWLKYNNKLKISGFKNVSELGEGDKVGIKYKLTKKDKKIILSEIKLIRKKPLEAQSALVADETPGGQT